MSGDVLEYHIAVPSIAFYILCKSCGNKGIINIALYIQIIKCTMLIARKVLRRDVDCGLLPLIRIRDFFMSIYIALSFVCLGHPFN